jgi:hypothetical protein
MSAHASLNDVCSVGEENAALQQQEFSGVMECAGQQPLLWSIVMWRI